MYRLITKADRLAARQYQFDKMIKEGYDQEEYKSLTFFVKDDNGKYYLRAFRGTSSNDYYWKYFRILEQRNERIAEEKKYEDCREEYKAEQKTKKQTSPHAGAAKTLKAELQTAFPGVKFSVKSDSFSMGDSVSVSYEDGPAYHIVDEIASKYQYGHFDGMNDIYENSNRRDDIPQSKYVNVSRHQSAATREILDAAVNEMFGEDFGKKHDEDMNLHELFQKTSIPAGAKVTGLGRTEVTCGRWVEFYTITYEGGDQVQTKPETAATAPVYEKVEVTAGEINIVDYSEKAFAVIGDTKPIKDLLGSLHGKFNKYLSCGPGWIFSKKRLAEVETALRAHAAGKSPLRLTA